MFFDAGVAWRTESVNPNLILVTHTHIDHCNALPMLLRTEASPVILAPRNHMPALKEMTDMTWSVKRAQWQPAQETLPLRPETPLRSVISVVGDVSEVRGRNSRRWIGAVPGDEFGLDLPKLSPGLELRVVRCYHTIEDVGFVLCEQSKTHKGIDDESDAEYHTLQQQIQAHKDAGEKRQAGLLGRSIGEMLKAGKLCEVRSSLPRLAYLCDTTVQVFGPCKGCRSGSACEFAKDYTVPCGPMHQLEQQAKLIFQCSTIVVECSFLAVGMDDAKAEKEAISRGHVAWTQLRPYVESHPEIEFILVHFSKRYSDQEVRAYFETASSSGSRPPNVLLWLDEGLSPGAEDAG